MKNLVAQILDLENQSKILEPNTIQRDEIIKYVQKYASQFLEKLPVEKAFNQLQPNFERLSLNSPEKSIEDILSVFDEEVVKKGIKPASGKHLGYVPGGGLYASAIGDFLSAITNVYAGMYYASPGAVAIENEVLNWLKDIFNYPQDAVGNLTSGGSIANLIALTAARDSYEIKNEKIKKSVIYLSPHAHHCIHKSLRIIGLEDVILRNVEVDENRKIIPTVLDELIKNDIEQKLNPFMVIASAGTTDTGAVDPLETIGILAKKHKIWFHIDAAYGGFFILLSEKKHLFKGIEMSDSLVVDPHKGLFMPYGSGAVLVKNKEAVFHSNHYTASYLQDAPETTFQINPSDVSPELTKHFRGLRIWLPLQLYGVKPFIASSEEKILLTTYFRNQLKELGFSLGPEPDLSISYFWYPASKISENKFNEKLMEFIHDHGAVFLTSTKIAGRFVIRMAILSIRTRKETIDEAIEMIKVCLQKTNLFFNN